MQFSLRCQSFTARRGPQYQWCISPILQREGLLDSWLGAVHAQPVLLAKGSQVINEMMDQASKCNRQSITNELTSSTNELRARMYGMRCPTLYY